MDLRKCLFYFADGEDVTAPIEYICPSFHEYNYFSLTVKRGTSVAPPPPPVTMPEVNWSGGGGLKMGSDAGDTASVMVMTPPGHIYRRHCYRAIS